jgi:hypothetical protein
MRYGDRGARRSNSCGFRFVEFDEGHRYGDYVAGADKVAAW